eukprot:8949533-Pyramimonas_sp.AAC.1
MERMHLSGTLGGAAATIQKSATHIMQVVGFGRRPFGNEHQHVEATFRHTFVEYPEADPDT